jgi:hypothetical protein
MLCITTVTTREPVLLYWYETLEVVDEWKIAAWA